ncbi:hypothetical protein PHMEG_00016488 [Phytophthora megakarya]|uniref:Uncharacterized protein n=1 Tax=Phytophthora megakarya TaxID=4795 RepID=A0A225W196_9STRA|nr:hypothetical protein PHMEG_00016488 [Phytophthora megakarya]
MSSFRSHSTTKNNYYPCPVDHTLVTECSITQTRHTMRTILTKCISARCAQVESVCACRIKINTCDISGLIVVYQEEQHAM